MSWADIDTLLRVRQDTLERGHCDDATCYHLRMDDKWFDRLIEAISRDGRDMKAISLNAKLGENYVQQLVKDRKKPRIDTLVRLLQALGRADTLYIITGTQFTAEDRRLLEVASALDDEGKQRLIEAFAALVKSQR